MQARPIYSLGCHACRRMKCDEGKPQCGRCIKARRICPGYRDTKQVMFRSMNSEVASKAGTSHPAHTQASAATPGHTDLMVVAAPGVFTPHLLTQPSEKWDAKAISHFLYNYSSSPSRSGPGYLGFLPDLLERNSSSNSGYLESAVLAAGSASLANITGLGHLQRDANRHYGETLRSISKALGDPTEASSDALLTAIVILQMYEAIIGITSVFGDPHEKGLLGLLRLRGCSQPSAGSGKDLLRIIHGRVHMNSVGGLFPSQMTTDYDFEVVDFPSHQFELWGLIRRTSQRCAEARAMIPAPGRTIFKSQIIESLDHVLSTYLRLFDWQATLPSSWLWQSCRIPTQEAHDPHQKPFPEKYHLFKNEHHGAMWISFWCTLIHILQTLVHLSALPTVQQVLSHSWHDRWGFRKRLRGAVDEICACAPYMMAEVDQMGLPTVGNDGKALGSFFLSRGLYVASCVEETTGAQRDYIMRTLLRIAHVKGIRLALRARNRCLGKHIGSVEPHD